jgi:hypothetical protein
MTSLEYVKGSSPPQFRSIGKKDELTNTFSESSDFPIGEVYTLGGKFPLNNYKDLFDKTGVPHTLNNVPVKLNAFDNSCQVGQVETFGNCIITVEKIPTAGSRKRKNRKSRKNKSRRFK